MSRFVLDTSTSQSSTAMNIRKFIRDTELSDHRANRDTSTLPSTTNQSNKEPEEKYLINDSHEPSFHFINKSLMDQINRSDHIDKSQTSDQMGPVKTISGQQEYGKKDVTGTNENNENKQNSDNNEHDNGNNSYQNKLKYLPNSDFKYDSNNSFSMNSMNSPISIPNTFKYKSHPNAKTKSQLGVSQVDSVPEVEEHSIPIPTKNKGDSQHDSDTPPMKTSTIKHIQQEEHNSLNNADFNATPDWMPEELADKWVPPKSFEIQNLENLDQGDFGSSVRITKQTDSNRDLDMNLQFSSTNTMIHNSKPMVNETPMWKKASKEYESNRKSQPQLHNIFLSMDSLKEEGTNIDKSAYISRGVQGEREHESEPNNNSASSTLSTPMASISNKSGTALTKNQIIQLENILEGEGKGKPNDFLLHVPNPESPLKLFGDKYNTFTKGKLTDLLQKINTKTPSSVNPQKSVENKKNKYGEAIPDSSNPLEEPHLRIKNFTKSGTYTEEQFLQNANNIFNNIQRRGFKMNQDLTHDMSYADGRQRSLSSAVNSQSTATSTPKNIKVNDIDKITSEDEYSSFTSGFEEHESTEFPQYNTDRGHAETHQNEYTSFDQSNSVKDNENASFSNLSPRNLQALQRELTHSNESIYTIDEGYTEDRNSNKNFKESNVNHGEKSEGNPNEIKYFANRLEELERMMKDLNVNAYQADIQKLENENTRLKHELERRTSSNGNQGDGCEVVIDDIDFTNDDLSQMQDFIKWKRASQLRLQNNNSLNGSPILKLKEKSGNQHPIIRGRVEPGIELPVAYDNMILDTKNQKWIANDKENQYHGSLDSIEDLLSRSEENEERGELNNTNNILGEGKPSTKSRKIARRNNDSKLEVSFNLPNMTDEIHETTHEYEDKSPSLNNVTHISQINDMTFSQTKKKLVAVITDILSVGQNFRPINWEKVTDIAMTGYQLDSIKDLNKFLPRLNNVDLSDNNIKFLDGLPKRVLNLNVSHNDIEHMTSFNKYHDLQHLNVSFNKLSNLSNVSNNIHLTELTALNNKLVSIDGIRKLENLTRIDVSQNDLMGEIDFANFKLVNLQELNISENSIQSLSGLECLPRLRILNANENQIMHISCMEKHSHLKKMLLKLNNLQKLNLEPYPFIRCLRIDGNNLNVVTDFKKLRHLEELSCKSQNNPDVINNMLNGSNDILKLDLSGNGNFDLFPNNPNVSGLNHNIHYEPFLNLNVLVLSAMNLSKLPADFAASFPNIRELNLNFNNLSNIAALSKMQNIKRLYMVSNNVREIGSVVESLKGVRNTLRVLDLRLNPINILVYPYVFNPQELDYLQLEIGNKTEGAPIQLETLDDIESFAIHYESLTRNHEDWSERDSKFFSHLKSNANLEKAKHRYNYETLLINFFNHLRKLDGGMITYDKRVSLTKRSKLEDVHGLIQS